MHVRHLTTFFALTITAGACATTYSGTGASTTTAVATSDQAPMAISLSTSSATARDEFLRGVRAGDVERNTIAREHFNRAVAADPNFALAHLYAAFYGESVTAYRNHLDEAIRLAPNASPAEQLWIRAEAANLNNDVNSQLALAQQLVQLTPSDPRAYGYLSGVQFNAGQRAESRATLERAGAIAASFAPNWVQLGDSYMQTEPRDLAKSAIYVRRAVALEPNQPHVYDHLGDLHRAENNLPEARAAYTRMIELDPSRASGYQQRGHVNSFLGNYAEARADYERAVELAEPASKPGFSMYRAIVSVYEGNPAAAEAELGRIAASVDALNIPNATGAKLGVLNSQALIALHHGHLDVAQAAIDQMRGLYRQQAEMGRSEAFKRSNESNIAYWEGIIAARRGDFATARTKAQEIMALRAPDQSPRKNEGAHELLGMADLLEGKHASAAGHFAQANPDDMYTTYYHALALEGAGRAAEAKPMFRRVGGWNFNSADVALIKADAARRGT
jgi:tetratricopeptide (TPR) repeat protein